MRYLVCLAVQSCGWSTQVDQEDYQNFQYICPECYGPAVAYTSKTNIDMEEEILGFLLPLIDEEAGDFGE